MSEPQRVVIVGEQTFVSSVEGPVAEKISASTHTATEIELAFSMCLEEPGLLVLQHQGDASLNFCHDLRQMLGRTKITIAAAVRPDDDDARSALFDAGADEVVSWDGDANILATALDRLRTKNLGDKRADVQAPGELVLKDERHSVIVEGFGANSILLRSQAPGIPGMVGLVEFTVQEQAFRIWGGIRVAERLPDGGWKLELRVVGVSERERADLAEWVAVLSGEPEAPAASGESSFADLQPVESDGATNQADQAHAFSDVGGEALAFGGSSFGGDGSMYNLDMADRWPRTVPSVEEGLAALTEGLAGHAVYPERFQIPTDSIIASLGQLERDAMLGEASVAAPEPIRRATLMRWRLAVGQSDAPAKGKPIDTNAAEELLAEVDATLNALEAPEGADRALQKGYEQLRKLLVKTAVDFSELVNQLRPIESDVAVERKGPSFTQVKRATGTKVMSIVSVTKAEKRRKRATWIALGVTLAAGAAYHGYELLPKQHRAQQEFPIAVPDGVRLLAAPGLETNHAMFNAIPGKSLDPAALVTMENQAAAKGMGVVKLPGGEGHYMMMPAEAATKLQSGIEAKRAEQTAAEQAEHPIQPTE